MRVGMHKLADADDATMLSHDFGDFQIVAQHMQSGKHRQVIHQLAIFGNRIGKRDAMLKMRQFIILNTMTRRDMDKAGSLISGHIVGKQHRYIMFIAMLMHRMAGHRAFNVPSGQRRQCFRRVDTNGGSDFVNQFAGKADDVIDL